MSTGIPEAASLMLTTTPLTPVLLLGELARAQPTATPETSARDMGSGCPMMDMGSGWMTAGMILTGLLTLAAIGALAALTLFLVRRSRPRAPAA